jgi:hypothetical protein
MRVPHRKRHEPEPWERERLAAHRAVFAHRAERAISVAEALRMIRDPRWVWTP